MEIYLIFSKACIQNQVSKQAKYFIGTMYVEALATYL